MRNKKIFVFKIVWRKSIATPHRLTQAVQRANLRRTAGDPTWVFIFTFAIVRDNRSLVCKILKNIKWNHGCLKIELQIKMAMDYSLFILSVVNGYKLSNYSQKRVRFYHSDG